MSKYTIDDIIKARKILEAGDVIKNIHVGHPGPDYGVDYNDYKYIVVDVSGYKGQLTYDVIPLQDYKNSKFSHSLQHVTLYGGTTVGFSAEYKNVKLREPVSTYEKCSDDELTTLQKVNSYYLKKSKTTMFLNHREPRNMIVRLTADLDSNIKAGSYVCLRIQFTGNGCFNYEIRIVKKSDKGILTFGCKRVTTEDLTFLDNISEYVDNPPQNVLDKYEENFIHKILYDVSIGSQIKCIDATAGLQYLNISSFEISEVYYKDANHIKTINKENEFEYPVNNKYNSKTYYYIVKLFTGEEDKINCDDVILKYRNYVRDGSIIQSKEDPDVTGLVYYTKFDPSDHTCTVLLKNSSTGISYFQSKDASEITTDDYDVIGNNKTNNLDRCGTSTRNKEYKEFANLVPGAQIEFVTDYEANPFVKIDKGTKGYIIETVKFDNSYSLYEETITFVAKTKNNYVTSFFKIPSGLSRPLVKVIKQTNIKDRSIFIKFVDLEEDSKNSAKFYEYINRQTILHHIQQNLDFYPEIKQLFSPKYGEFKPITKEDATDILADAGVKRFLYLNGLQNNEKAIQTLLKDKHLKEFFTSYIETTSQAVQLRNYLNFYMIKYYFSDEALTIKIIEPNDCEEVEAGKTYYAKVVKYPTFLIKDCSNESGSFERVNLQNARFEIVNDMTPSQKDSVSKTSPVDNPDYLSIKELMEAWEQDMLKFLKEEPGLPRYKYPDSMNEEWETKDILELGDFSGKGGPDEEDVDCPDTDDEFRFLYGDALYAEFCELNGVEYLPPRDSLKNKTVKSLIYAFIDMYQECYGFQSIDSIKEDALAEYND